jgi:hypothetical protein
MRIEQRRGSSLRKCEARWRVYRRLPGCGGSSFSDFLDSFDISGSFIELPNKQSHSCRDHGANPEVQICPSFRTNTTPHTSENDTFSKTEQSECSEKSTIDEDSSHAITATLRRHNASSTIGGAQSNITEGLGVE